MKRILLLCVLTIISISTYAQSYEVPKNYVLEAVEDYEPYEEKIIETVDWLINTSVNTQENKRADAKTFLMKWVMGAPKVKIVLNTENSDFGNPEYLMIFIGAWAKDNISKKEYDNPVNGNLAGINGVIEFYSKNKSTLGKNKKIEKLIKLKTKGKLVDYIKDKMLV
ncbi:hypothetical protein [Urechidicola croceus]|uniref:Uncharacterized protein n=1 Tax=Urechidicola croceus TaxID=1850246 RepID=A0A1D8P968_9FLAO|nr:hypothetical protein [Urechidicola croceus]AOW21114.1 hypothetical protein LPB138_10680 [Urechidicola croceus]